VARLDEPVTRRPVCDPLGVDREADAVPGHERRSGERIELGLCELGHQLAIATS